MLSHVLNALMQKMGRYIKAPFTWEALKETIYGFYVVAGILGVIRAVVLVSNCKLLGQTRH